MKAQERTMNSIQKDVEKLQTRLEKAKARYDKKTVLCQKLGCDWSDDEYLHIQNIFWKRHAGETIVPFGQDDDLITEKQSSAWFERSVIGDEIEDLEIRLDKAQKRLTKAIMEFEEIKVESEELEAINQKENSWLINREKAEKEYQAWLKQFKAECLKDGIIIENADADVIYGKTKSGENFSMYLNWNGITNRSRHCYTLRIDGETIFTSGLFSTGYSIIKR